MTAHRRILGREWLLKFLYVIVRKVINDDRYRIENKHEARDGLLKISTNRLIETGDLNIGKCGGDAKLVDKGKNSARWYTSSTKGNKGEEARVVPVTDNFFLY